MSHVAVDGCGRAGLVAPDHAAVDADVAAAVGGVLAGELEWRVAACTSIDAVFGRDVAERVASFTLSGGKRMRSQFFWWGLRACGPGTSAVPVAAGLRLAAALELLQTCALVHDDVMDGASLRRGRPSVHSDIDGQYGSPRGNGSAEPFGRAAAILVGDLALAWADDTVAGTDLPPAAGREVRRIWQATRTEMVAGQYLDLHAQATGPVSTAQAGRIACLKSALYSVARPLELGAVLGGADEATARALSAAARCAGLAFQLRDDLLDVFGDPAGTGKSPGGDLRHGRPNQLLVLARERAEADGDDRLLGHLDAAAGRRGTPEAELDRVREIITANGSRAAVVSRIERLAERSARCLARAPGVAPAARDRLLDLFRRTAGLHPAEPAATRPDTCRDRDAGRTAAPDRPESEGGAR
ncbi:polyprenyl synthetase family protein [Streptomyces sp. NPDC049040]|uniref:polyprenyl synthetase family protein n=1 Tax=Streptomyces sp. NPDC049040 TaxID=3365593 RepID=UPI003720A2DE